MQPRSRHPLLQLLLVIINNSALHHPPTLPQRDEEQEGEPNLKSQKGGKPNKPR
jgi:hypothetical protein